MSRASRKHQADEEEAVLEAIAQSTPSSSGWVRVPCPYCFLSSGKKDSKASFGAHISGRYHCFRCGAAGRLRNLADWMDREKKIEVGDVKLFDPPPTFTPLGFEPGRSAQTFTQARNYLRGRGILEDTWFDAGLGVCLKGRDRGRVVVPILAPNGRDWYGYVGRDYTGKAERKYLYPAEMSRGIILYEERALDEATERPVLVVEGVFDVLPFFGDAVALLGKPSEWQIDRLTKTTRPVAIVLDGDAFEEGYVLAARLRMAGQRAGSVKLPPRIDPDEVDRDWLFEQAARAIETGEAGVA